MEVLKLYLTVLVISQAGIAKPYIRNAKVVKTANRSFHLYLPQEIFEHCFMQIFSSSKTNLVFDDYGCTYMSDKTYVKNRDKTNKDL